MFPKFTQIETVLITGDGLQILLLILTKPKQID